MTAPLDAGRELDVLLAEYGELKSEQRTRIRIRDHLGYATMAAIGLVVAGGRVTGTAPTPVMWLVLPLAVLVLGWTRLQNDLKISAVGRYVRQDLAPRASALVGRPVMGWEASHNGPGTSRPLRMVCQLVANLILFGAAPVAALAAFWTSGPLAGHWLAISVAEAVLVAGLIYMVVAGADIRPPAPSSESPATVGDVTPPPPPVPTIEEAVEALAARLAEIRAAGATQVCAGDIGKDFFDTVRTRPWVTAQLSQMGKSGDLIMTNAHGVYLFPKVVNRLWPVRVD